MADPTENGGASPTGHGAAMDRMYAAQRHIYDVTRKFYLLGRDRMIADLAIPDGGSVLELGCGTGRNLIAIAKAFPDAKVFGSDISTEMLKTARESIDKAGLGARIALAQGDATAFDPATFPALQDGSTAPDGGFERVVFSYSLSMIPDWEGAVKEGLRLTRPGGRLAMVDFGSCERLPKLLRGGLYFWLKQFHVTPREDLPTLAATLAEETGAFAGTRKPFRGYAQIVTIDKPLSGSSAG